MRTFGGLVDTTDGGLGRLDDLVVAGLFLTLAFAAFAFGAVHQWAYTLTETAQFALLIGWMAHVRLEGAKPARSAITRANLVGLALPAALFALLLGFQIAPIPPAAMRVIAPATWRLYAESFPGWPETAPYQALRAAWSSNPRGAGLPLQMTLPPVGEQKPARARAAAPTAVAKVQPAEPERPSPAKLGHFGDLRWRSIAIAPSVTWAALIELLACGAVFFLILCYPFGFAGAEREANARFMHRLVLALITIGAAVALIGLVEKATWNGRILWFFVPQDWPTAAPENVRASGPFVNPDHFANFLAILLPLAAVGAIFPLAAVRREHAADLRTPCAVAAFLMAAGILLSLSRGAWIASTAGVCLGLGLSFNHARERAPALLNRLGARTLPLLLAGLVIFLLLLLFVIGPSGRDEATSRIGSTILRGDSLGLKPSAWRDSLRMIADFPVFGVGLGCWPEIFPHYQRPPAMQFFYRQPENDYIQFLAETGLAGALLAIWFGAAVWRKCRAAAAQLTARQWPLFAGLGAGIAAALIHEFFDFSLHTPANALLFIVVLAALLRLALTADTRRVAGLRTVSTPSRFTYAGAAAIAASAVALIVATQFQLNAAYPYDIGTPRTFTQAETAAVKHPADSGIHLALAALMPPGAPALLRRRELQAAVWLNPNDPLARDVYARSLLLDGNKRDGLEQITLSVFHSPELDSHFYLQPRAIQWLLPEEQQAVYEGFGRAIEAGYASSAHDLAAFYRELGRYFEAAEVEQKAAGASDDDATRFAYLVGAGQDYAQDGELTKAQAQFRAAIEIDPSDPQPYCDLMVKVLGRNHDLKAANAVADEAVSAGVDELTIEQARADAARAAGDASAAEAALIQVSKDAPTFTSMMNLGGFYSDSGKYDRAAIAFQHALEIDPTSAQAFFSLAQAEQASFDFASANRDYQHALQLAPNEEGMRRTYDEFRRRVEQARKAPPGG
jgi:tetratricopeptide (TPR) repeat protein/O-antigen ligase